MGVQEKLPAYGMVKCILTRPDCEFGEMKSTSGDRHIRFSALCIQTHSQLECREENKAGSKLRERFVVMSS